VEWWFAIENRSIKKANGTVPFSSLRNHMNWWGVKPQVPSKITSALWHSLILVCLMSSVAASSVEMVSPSSYVLSLLRSCQCEACLLIQCWHLCFNKWLTTNGLTTQLTSYLINRLYICRVWDSHSNEYKEYCVLASLYIYLPIYIPTCMPTYVHTYLHAYLRTYLPSCLPA
jgi:hypothetical protein